MTTELTGWKNTLNGKQFNQRADQQQDEASDRTRRFELRQRKDEELMMSDVAEEAGVPTNVLAIKPLALLPCQSQSATHTNIPPPIHYVEVCIGSVPSFAESNCRTVSFQ